MSRKDEILWALMNSLVKKEEAATAKGPAASGFDWQTEEKVGYEPVQENYGGKGYYEEKPDYCWHEEPEYPKKEYCHKKEKEYYCHGPWEEEKWICKKEARICCQKIDCEKEKEPCDCGCRGNKRW